MIFARLSEPKDFNGLRCAKDTCEMSAHFRDACRNNSLVCLPLVDGGSGLAGVGQVGAVAELRTFAFGSQRPSFTSNAK